MEHLGTNPSWTLITTANPATFNLDVSGLVAGHKNVKFKWNYNGTFGNYWAIDDISITGTAPSVWIGTTSSDWTTLSNWSPAVLPSNTEVVIIPSSAPHWPVISGDLVVGANCFNLRLTEASRNDCHRQFDNWRQQFTDLSGNGQLNIGGNWTNYGTFLPDAGTIKFTGNSPAEIIGYTTSPNIAGYVYSTFTKGMTALTGNNPSLPEVDNATVNVPIGFTFNYMGLNYTQAHICANGWLSLNLTGGGQTL